MPSANPAPLLAGTIVPVPFGKTSDLTWQQQLRYWKEVATQRFVDRVAIAQQTWQLKRESWYERATFRAPREGIVDAAIELHAEMSRCLAVGGVAEKRRLAQICVPKLHRSLVAAIESRPRGRSYTWKCVSLERSSLLWPRLVDHKWTDIDVGYMQSFRQAVVGVRSKQSLTELDAKGKVVGGTTEKDVTEYLVLWKSVDKESLTQGDWLLYGTLKEMSLNEILEEKETMQTLADAMASDNLQQRKKLGGK